jgi:hypothetical protein
MAQDCATDCTGGGVLRVMTADTDPAQLVHEYVQHDNRGMGSSVFEIVAGPFVLTDLGLAREDIPHTIFTTTEEATCPLAEGPPMAEAFTVLALDGQVGMTSVNTRYVHEIHGGRYLIPSGSRLCAVVNFDAIYRIRYAGFRPYD